MVKASVAVGDAGAGAGAGLAVTIFGLSAAGSKNPSVKALRQTGSNAEASWPPRQKSWTIDRPPLAVSSNSSDTISDTVRPS